jgi:spore coat protein U-like protein
MPTPKLRSALVAALVVLTGIGFAARPACAGENVGTVSSPLVTASSVEIINGTGQQLQFAIRPANGVWRVYSVASGKNIEINCKSCSTASFDFSMGTGGVTVKHRLLPAMRYILRWDEGRKLFDLYTVKN